MAEYSLVVKIGLYSTYTNIIYQKYICAGRGKPYLDY
jgi:hypothetical protein